MLKLPAAFFTLTLLLLLLSTAFSAPKKAPLKIRADTSHVEIRKFSAQAIAKFKVDKDFNYSGEGVGEPSFWDVFWQWFWNLIAKLFKSVPYSGKILEYLLIGLSVAFLIYVIFRTFGLDVANLLSGEAKKMNLPYSESLENIHDINFDDEIEKAVVQHNYRLAVRLLYLKCLKQLSDGNLIRWQIDKTNSAYIYELTDPGQKQIFGLLTRQFEYVWYGNFLIDKQAFTAINQLFQTFKKQLQ